MTDTKAPLGPTTLEELTETEADEAERAAARRPPPGSPLEAKADAGEAHVEGAVPGWAREWMVPTVKMPRGRRVAFLRFKSKWTDAPWKGVPSQWPERLPGQAQATLVEHLSRVVVLWTLSDAEETLALKQARGDFARTGAEYAKRMLRMVDGKQVDWTGMFATAQDALVDANEVWRDLGKCRQPILNLYLRLSKLDDDEASDFLVNGLSIASAVAG